MLLLGQQSRLGEGEGPLMSVSTGLLLSSLPAPHPSAPSRSCSGTPSFQPGDALPWSSTSCLGTPEVPDLASFLPKCLLWSGNKLDVFTCTLLFNPHELKPEDLILKNSIIFILQMTKPRHVQ